MCEKRTAGSRTQDTGHWIPGTLFGAHKQMAAHEWHGHVRLAWAWVWDWARVWTRVGWWKCSKDVRSQRRAWNFQRTTRAPHWNRMWIRVVARKLLELIKYSLIGNAHRAPGNQSDQVNRLVEVKTESLVNFETQFRFGRSARRTYPGLLNPRKSEQNRTEPNRIEIRSPNIKPAKSCSSLWCVLPTIKRENKYPRDTSNKCTQIYNIHIAVAECISLVEFHSFRENWYMLYIFF